MAMASETLMYSHVSKDSGVMILLQLIEANHGIIRIMLLQ